MLEMMRKVSRILPQDNISDHWKEKAFPAYAIKMMKCSLKMFLILLSILFLFFIADYFWKDFLNFSISLIGIIEAVIFALGYISIRKFLVR